MHTGFDKTKPLQVGILPQTIHSQRRIHQYVLSATLGFYDIVSLSDFSKA